jgi:hypothetical protein
VACLLLWLLPPPPPPPLYPQLGSYSQSICAYVHAYSHCDYDPRPALQAARSTKAGAGGGPVFQLAAGAHRRGHEARWPASRWYVVPRSRQPRQQAAEAMPSSRGDARAAERARTGGAKIAPRRGQRISTSTPLEKSAHGLRSGGIGSST